MAMQLSKRLTAEFIGTLWLVLRGRGSALLAAAIACGREGRAVGTLKQPRRDLRVDGSEVHVPAEPEQAASEARSRQLN
jgi:hypothetical protein